MKHSIYNRWIALLLVLAMCVTFLPVAVYAEDGPNETQSRTDATEQTTEDASAQLGAYTPPAAEAEQALPPPTEAQATDEEPATQATEETVETAPTEPEAPVRGEPLQVDAAANEGRDYAGQVTMAVDGTDFILVGSKQQLQALDYYPDFVSAGSLDQNSAALTDA